MSRTWRYRLIGATPSSVARLRMVIWSERPSRTARAAASTTCSLVILPHAARTLGRDLLRGGYFRAAMQKSYPKMCTHTQDGHMYA